jgi:Domain of Unknown Function (DUF1206)
MPRRPNTPRKANKPQIDTRESAFAWIGRAGYAARGLIFMLLGALATIAAVRGGRAVGTPGALHRLMGAPLGDVLLWIIAAGLVCFAAWRILQGVLDADRLGTTPSALVRRIAIAGSALFYLALAALAVGIIFGARTGDDDRIARDWTAWLLGQPLGQLVTFGVGAGTAVFGFVQMAKPARADFRKQIALEGGARTGAMALAVLGYFARGLLFVLIGIFFAVAAWRFNSGEAAGLAGALRALQAQSYGPYLLGATALGLFAFGLLQFVQALWRRIDAPEVKDVAAKGAGLYSAF